MATIDAPFVEEDHGAATQAVDSTPRRGVAMARFEWLGLSTGPTSLAYTELQMHSIVARVAAAQEEHWDSLAASYPEHLEALVAGLGQYLRQRHPAAAMNRSPEALRSSRPRS